MKKRIYIICLLSFFGNLMLHAQLDQRRGDKMFEAERYAEALTYYLKALEEDENNSYLNHQTARCYAEIMDGSNTIKYIEEAFKNTPKPTLQMYYTAARGHHLNHDFDKAKNYYKMSDPYNANKREIVKRLAECETGKTLVKKPTKVKIANLGEKVNSPYHDVLPQITADLRLMYFTSQRPGHVGDAPEDIYMSLNLQKQWNKPKHLDKPINTENNDACIGLSPDGHTMFIFNGSNGGDIYMAERKKGKWKKPEPLPFNTPERESSVCMAPDGRSIYFVRQNIDDYGRKTGDSDIYVCRRTASGTWSKPQKISSSINTPYDEESPFIHPDGKTLYFSSKGHNTMGGYDIFRSEKTESGAWSKPINMGYPINTAGDDLCFVITADGKLGFYSSAKPGGLGGHDIYAIYMPVSRQKPDLALLRGKVKEEFTNKPVEAKITITNNATNLVVAEFYSDEETGDYLVSLPSGTNYGISIEKDGHLFHSENVFIEKGIGYVPILKNIKLVNIQPGAKIVLNNIFFETGKYALTKESHSELNKLSTLLNKHTELNIEISGHTDGRGDPELNMTLSENRAKAVVDYLVSKGIDRSRLNAKGYGITQPVASNDTPQGRAKNRRTEFKILE